MAIVHTHLQHGTHGRPISTPAAGAAAGCATEHLLPVCTLHNAKCPPEN